MNCFWHNIFWPMLIVILELQCAIWIRWLYRTCIYRFSTFMHFIMTKYFYFTMPFINSIVFCIFARSTKRWFYIYRSKKYLKVLSFKFSFVNKTNEFYLSYQWKYILHITTVIWWIRVWVPFPDVLISICIKWLISVLRP